MTCFAFWTRPEGALFAAILGASLVWRRRRAAAIRLWTVFAVVVAPVLVGDQWYYVAPDGRTAPVIPFDNGADRFREGLARTRASGRIGYIDRSLRAAIPPRYDFAWPFENGRALVCMGCKPGEPDSDGHRAVIGGQWGYIDRDGRTVEPIRLTRDEALALGSR